MKLTMVTILTLLFALAGITADVDTFVFEVEGLICEESRHAVEQALDGIPHLKYVGVDLMKKEVIVDAEPGKVEAKQLLDAINAAEDSHGSFKATLKKEPRPQ